MGNKNLFDDNLYTKKPVSTTKTLILKSWKTCIFPKGLVHGFSKKIKIFSFFFYILCQIGQENVADDILHRKKVFLDNKNVAFKN